MVGEYLSFHLLMGLSHEIMDGFGRLNWSDLVCWVRATG